MGIWHSGFLPPMSSSSTSPTTLSQGGVIAHATLEEELIIRRCISPILRRRWLCRDQLAGQVPISQLLILELTNRPFLPLPIKNQQSSIDNLLTSDPPPHSPLRPRKPLLRCRVSLLRPGKHTLRMWLQFAADAEWPYIDPANTPIRREFQLPATRAFIG